MIDCLDNNNATQKKPVGKLNYFANNLSQIFQKSKKYLPNFLTILRILMVPFFVFILIPPTSQFGNIIAVSIFIIASFTDWLDGYLARAFKAESVIGKMMDPLADKVLVLAALIMLSAGPDPRVPAWITVILISRDVIITGLRSLAAFKGEIVSAIMLAKYKTATTMLGITFLLVGGTYSAFGIQVNFKEVGNFIIWIALILSLVSATQYFIKLRKLLSAEIGA
ncbi:MAG: CDP-diacylglycerol--glycerol-3-phosphate 3-phosphatidyltransferase [Deltaproteobacteria bacterium]|nr:CDP-diacylglycerol--glycerol-3-phosphate 3-phosphatidyltransferase [Deltaproteobacteria bacterium]